MYDDEHFQQFGAVQGGRLVMKLPGTDLVMPYETGKGYTNQEGTIGFVKFRPTTILVEEVGEMAQGGLGQLEAMLREKFKNPAVQEALKRIMPQMPVTLIYSRAADGKDIITYPGMLGAAGSFDVDGNSLPGIVSCSYSTTGTIPGVDAVYTFHKKACEGRILVDDAELVRRETLRLPDRTNKLYEEALPIIKASGL